MQIRKPEENEEIPPNLHRATSEVSVLSQPSVSSQQLTQQSNSKTRQKAKGEVLDHKILTQVSQLITEQQNPTNNPTVTEVVSKKGAHINTLVDYIKSTLERCSPSLELEMQHKLMDVCFWAIRKLNSEQAKQNSPFKSNNREEADNTDSVFDD